MLIENANKEPLKTRFYLERYVNDGSPSGFTSIYRSSANTDPFGSWPWFQLNLMKVPIEYCETYGVIPDWPSPENDNWIFIHPDLDLTTIKDDMVQVELFESYRVTPTSSTRTVQFIDGMDNDYAKLHFDGILGRVNRALPLKKAISGPEIFRDLEENLTNGSLPENLCLLPESGARVIKLPFKNGEVKEIGMIWRKNQPCGQRASEVTHIWPLFSLFSTDRLSPLDPYLLIQLTSSSEKDPVTYALEKIIFPAIECYMSLILKFGYQVECNAQNLMVGLNDRLEIVSLVIRDIGRFEKDITIRKHLGLNVKFESFPYKCISEEQELYQIRHSFAFDFKLIQYIILPIVETIAREYGVNRTLVDQKIKDFIRPYIENLPRQYFPQDGKWYKHERILLINERPYVGMDNPKYR